MTDERATLRLAVELERTAEVNGIRLSEIGNQALERLRLRLCRLFYFEVPEEHDTHRSDVTTVRVSTDDVLPSLAPLVHAPCFIDDKVVPDIPPALVLRMILVERTHTLKR
jgi:hypothetical protein